MMTAAATAFTHLIAAHHAVDEAKAERDAVIVKAYLDGMKPASILRMLDDALESLDVPLTERRGLGASESSVHLALRVAGVKSQA